MPLDLLPLEHAYERAMLPSNPSDFMGLRHEPRIVALTVTVPSLDGGVWGSVGRRLRSPWRHIRAAGFPSNFWVGWWWGFSSRVPCSGIGVGSG